jgi:hypothetical protein
MKVLLNKTAIAGTALAIVCLLVACASDWNARPVYGRYDRDCDGIAEIQNSAAGSRILKDRYVLYGVNGDRVVLAPKPEFHAISVRCGKQEVDLAFLGFKDGLGNAAIGAQVSCVFTPKAGGRYAVRGELAGETALMWIDDTESGKPVTEKLSAPITARQQFDPVRPYP